ncbi:glycoside hydrolase family 97 catalytic domain-containing protein [Streptomyces yaanensis]|uniref:Glycoside hydrolase family 97 catalytic domain-containing protein n=1 Tax=Streptomyces yaanensis TaxID=1142239 RepID=A0ABV7SA10_9ACTN|nr:glycoside hydrolase family 97 catalytic domain-containing protein [Streptomyces sp. CGMCC 4.7035]WNB96715.1 glycoside hydrolase family 97 catalytic domain-containing protein [Streptomyces sp. CGMCC 4.7035]
MPCADLRRGVRAPPPTVPPVLRPRKSALTDTSWIKPGKVFRCELTTAAGLAGVDFAVARGLEYIEYDAGWYGPEFSTVDATTPITAIDLPSVISYATSKGIGVFLYVNRLALTDADSLFGLYKSWGVAGIKLGFINDGTQAMTNQIIDWARTAAKYRLLIDMHDDVRPFGFERTYPNYISLEGVRGNEQFPTATHNVTLPFARRNGSTWHLGAMTNETARTLSIPLSFLDSGTFAATVYADGTPGSSSYRTPVVVSTATVTSGTTLDVVMASAGGQAIVLTPN